MPLLRGPYNARPPAGAAPHSGGRRRKRAGLELLLRNPLFFLIFAVRVSQKFCRATMTQAEMAKVINMSIRGYQDLERGVMPRSDKLLAIAEFYQVSIDWLMGRTDKREVNR